MEVPRQHLWATEDEARAKFAELLEMEVGNL
jgi:hypothetical protein